MADDRRIVPLWESNGEETHGGENNGGARRVFSPATGKYSSMAGLSEWANVRAFGFFESGNGADPPRGGGTAGQINTVDYITGMPDLRTEHLHAIDLVTPDGKGFDRCRIVWKGECIDYEGLAIDWPNVPDSTNNQWADEVYACAWGEEWINPAKPYMNFPPALWANNNDTLAGEGVGSNFASNQVLANNALTGGTSWSGANGFVVGGSNTAVYTHNASGGTLLGPLAPPAEAERPARR